MKIIRSVAFLGMFWSILVGLMGGMNEAVAQNADIQEQLRQRLWAFRDTLQVPLVANEKEQLRSLAAVQQFYEQRGYRPAWILGLYIPPNTKEMVQAIQQADDNGLVPEEYHYSAIQQIINTFNAETTPVTDLVDLDLLLTDAYLLLSQHYAKGKVDPKSIGISWHLTKKMFNPISYLNRTLDSNMSPASSLNKLLPQSPAYDALRKALKAYRQTNDWDSKIPYSWSTMVQRGYRDPLVPSIRSVLTATGDLTTTESLDASIYDRAVETAVMSFQRRHGLHYDGITRGTTITAMNVSRQERVNQLIANLERWRWMPDNLGNSFVIVNVPEFNLYVFDKGELKYKEAVIVGREAYQTPSFSDSLQYIIFNPLWYLPKSIAKNELLPELAYDKNLFINRDIRVFKNGQRIDPQKVDWVKANSDDYTFAQAASAYNPMGVVKFMFPNPYDIYIHDTPTRELFDNSRRSYSHGCVRVKDPVKFASFLLEGDATWDSTRIKKVLFSQKQTQVNLPKPIPIHLLYWTAFVDMENNEPNFREDLYRWDEKLTKAILEYKK